MRGSSFVSWVYDGAKNSRKGVALLSFVLLVEIRQARVVIKNEIP